MLITRTSPVTKITATLDIDITEEQMSDTQQDLKETVQSEMTSVSIKEDLKDKKKKHDKEDK
jgi:hypothetical protein